MRAPIAVRAIEIIDGVNGRDPLAPLAYADALPADAAALVRVLRDERIIQAAATYHHSDVLAGSAQTSFRRLGAGAAYSGFAAAVLGGAVLYLGSESANETLRSNLGLGQFVLLAISVLCAFLLLLFKPFRTWRTQRSNAEASRLRVFALMMNASSEVREGEVPLLPLQLECFRRCLVDDQRSFFARRGPQERRKVVIWQILGVVAVLLVLAASVPQILRLERFELLPDALVSLIKNANLQQRGYALVGLLGGSLQSLLAALVVISPVQRNAEKYTKMREKLDEHSKQPLDKAREAAIRNDGDGVRGFTKNVSDDLAEEGREWRLLHEALSEMALTQLANQRKA